MKKVLFKVIVPTMFIAVWMWTCYLICNKTEGFDCFLYWILTGCPFGIRRMCLWLIPKNFGISGSIGVLALNCIAGGLKTKKMIRNYNSADHLFVIHENKMIIFSY